MTACSAALDFCTQEIYQLCIVHISFIDQQAVALLGGIKFVHMHRETISSVAN